MSNFYKLVNENEYEKFNEEFFENIHGKLNTSVDINGSTINLEWFDFVYGVCPYINEIFEDAKTFLKEEEEILNVEKVKKVTVATIKHLSKHTNFVRDFDIKKRKVIPEKLLNSFKEDTYNTYENRFICTLVDDFEIFLNDVENQIKKCSLNLVNTLVLNSESSVLNEKIKFNCSVESSSDTSPSYVDFNHKSEIVRNYILGWKETFLYKKFISEHMIKVSSPLKRTNVILKNPNFQQAARLWDFIHGFELSIANVNHDVKSYDKVDENFDKYLQNVFLSLYYLTMCNNANDEYTRNYYLEAYNRVVAGAFKSFIRNSFKENKIPREYLINLIDHEYESFKTEKVVDDNFVVEKINSDSLSFLDQINSTFFSVGYPNIEMLHEEKNDVDEYSEDAFTLKSKKIADDGEDLSDNNVDNDNNI